MDQRLPSGLLSTQLSILSLNRRAQPSLTPRSFVQVTNIYWGYERPWHRPRALKFFLQNTHSCKHDYSRFLKYIGL